MRRRTEADIGALNNAFAETRSERDAERDYRYEARKRLYTEIQPLVFQFMESSENALRRITGLASRARDGQLGWLQGGYYLLSTTYRLVAPLAVFRLIQRRLTVVDFSVDERIQVQYAIAKQLHFSSADAHELARFGIKGLEYKPHTQEADDRDYDQAIHLQQHLPVGQLDVVADALPIREVDGILRCMSYGEFEVRFGDDQSDVYRATSAPANVFREFHPRTSPILWRILITQAHLYKALLKAFHEGSTTFDSPASLWSAEDRQAIDWRRRQVEGNPSGPDAGVSDAEVFEWPCTAAEQYLYEQLAPSFGADLCSTAPSCPTHARGSPRGSALTRRVPLRSGRNVRPVSSCPSDPTRGHGGSPCRPPGRPGSLATAAQEAAR